MKERGGLFSNTVILGGAAALSKGMAFFLLPFYTACLSPAEFGTADLVVDTAVLLLPLVGLNAPEAVFRFLAGREGNRAEVVCAGGTILLTGGALFLAATPLLLLFPLLRSFAPYLVCYVIASLCRSFLSHILRGEGRYLAYAVQQVCCAALTALLQIFFLLGLTLGAKGYLLGVIVSDATVALFLLFLVRPWQCFFLTRATREKLRPMLAYALPLIPTAVLWWVTSISDRYIILHYCGSGATGLYAAAARIPTVLTFAVGVFMEAWQYAAIGTEDAAREAYFSRVYGMLLGVSACGAASLVALAHPLVVLVCAPEYESAVTLIPTLTLASLFSALSSFLGSIYAVKLRSSASLLTALFSALVNIFLNFLLIPQAGAFGAALATLISYFLLFLVRLLHTRRYISFSHRALSLTLSVAFLSVASYAVTRGAYGLALLPALLSPLPFWYEIGEVLCFFWQKWSFLSRKRQKNTPPC